MEIECLETRTQTSMASRAKIERVITCVMSSVRMMLFPRLLLELEAAIVVPTPMRVSCWELRRGEVRLDWE